MLEFKQQPKVCQLEASRGGHKDICRFQVQMNETMRMQMLQCGEQVTQVGPRSRLICDNAIASLAQWQTRHFLTVESNDSADIRKYHRRTWAGRLGLSMQQQSGATQLCLNVQAVTFLPGCHKVEDVRVRTQPLMVPGFPHAPSPVTVAPEAKSGALHRILTAVLVALHLEKIYH